MSKLPFFFYRLSCGKNLRILDLVSMLYGWMYSHFRYLVIFLWVDILVIMMGLYASQFCHRRSSSICTVLIILKKYTGTQELQLCSNHPHWTIESFMELMDCRFTITII